MGTQSTIGFIGLGVMGGPMCRNMAMKHPGRVRAFDLNAASFETLADTRHERAASVADLARDCDIVFLSLPGGAQVKSVCLGDGGIRGAARPGMAVVDLSTTSVDLAHEMERELATHGVAFADAPVARTRDAAWKGQLSVMVGASQPLYDRIKPFIEYIASDITHGGDVGCGQVLKLVNNMLVFEHVVALAEMMVVAERAGVKADVMLAAVSKGSGDSFVLRNHGLKAMLPRSFPDKAFPPEYVLKDIGYVLELARSCKVAPHMAEMAQRYYQASIAAGGSGRYFPSVIEVVENSGVPAGAQTKG